MNIALIGPSGGGKGTHIRRLSAEFGLFPLSTGSLFRENLQRNSALGILARNYIAQGELVPDEVVDAMIEECLGKITPDRGVIFDGFPRTVRQAKFLDEFFAQAGRQLDAIVYLEVPDAEIVRRLSGRLTCQLCQAPFHSDLSPFKSCPEGRCEGEHLYHRDDDNPALISNRMRAFHRVTGNLVEYYYSSGRIPILIDGHRPEAEVGRSLQDALTAVQQRAGVATPESEIARVVALGAPPVPLAPEQTRAKTADLVFIGGPGSGKGTQAEALARALNIPHIATGDLFREHLKQQTDLGRLAKSYMDRGDLVPDDLTEAMVQSGLASPRASEGFILDGFPRTLAQSEALTDMLTHMQRRLAGAIYLRVGDDEIVHRLSGRLTCRSCQSPYHLQFKPPQVAGRCDLCGGELYRRDDDNPETIRARLRNFHRRRAPIVNYYRTLGLLAEVDGEGGLAAVTQRTLEAARELIGHSNSAAR